MRYLHIAIQVLISITSALGAYLVPTPRQTPSTDRLTATPTLTSTPMPTTLVPRASPKSICKCATFGSEYLPCHDGHKCAFSQKSDCDMYGAYYIFDTVNGHTSRATRTVFPTTAFDKDCDGTKGLPTAVCCNDKKNPYKSKYLITFPGFFIATYWLCVPSKASGDGSGWTAVMTNCIFAYHSHCPTSTPTTTLQPTTTSTDGTTSSTGNATSSTEAKSHKGYTESQKIELGIGISFGSFMAILGVWKCIKRSCS